MMLGIEREIVIMKLIEHPNVMRLYDVWETVTDLYLIMEYVEGGELFDYLVSKGRLHADEALHYFQQMFVLAALCHFRSQVALLTLFSWRLPWQHRGRFILSPVQHLPPRP
jgi:serine/threonine protein kinase